MAAVPSCWYSSYGSEPQTDVDIENAIRNFLGQVEPATGYSLNRPELPRSVCQWMAPRLPAPRSDPAVGGAA